MPCGGCDTAARQVWKCFCLLQAGCVQAGLQPAAGSLLLTQQLRKPPKSLSPGGSALAPRWDREVPALGLLSWSLPVFLLHSLKAKLTLASGALSFIPDCCSPQPFPCIFTGPVESPVCPCPAPGHPPLGQLDIQHPAPSIFSSPCTGLDASLKSPLPVCHMYGLLGQGAEPQRIPAGSHGASRQDSMAACRVLACSWYL